MSVINCPGCGKEMEKREEPDIAIDFCKHCKGIFLDKSELNALATGMGGDIEYCSIDQEQVKDKFPERKCPKCDSWVMKKAALLCHTDIILDFCPNCGGFYVDKGELDQINIELEDLTYTRTSEEYRGKIDGYLVRLDKVPHVIVGGGALGIDAVAEGVDSYFRLSVYFKQSLGIGLSLTTEKWTRKLLKTLRISRKQDIIIGDEGFDKSFLIQGENESKVKEIFSKDQLRKKILDFISEDPKILGKKIIFEIQDDKIVALAGPFSEADRYNVEEDPDGIVKKMIGIAGLFE